MNAKPFELTVADRATTGVSVRADWLVLRPTAPAIGLSVAMTVIGSGLLVCANGHEPPSSVVNRGGHA